jgi:asparagine synthase (glutamine-hydrolysing)
MCGIAGYLAAAPVADDVLVRMTKRIAHRGPDEEGFHRAGGLGLGFRRLAVIDLALSHQPMTTPDGALTIVFNGEIYNFRRLREELIARGHRFATNGDTETLLYAYREYGTKMLEHVQGMFAFALWDAQRSRLMVARDHFGVKPLYYFWDGRTFVFGSELKAVREHPGVTGAIDLDALGLYLECQYIPSPKTIYRDVRKLEASHALTIEGGKLQSWRYWAPDYSHKLPDDEDAAIAAADAELRKSVEAMMVADVPLGTFLSGGVDSSLVSAIAADVKGAPIDTFHLGFREDTPSNEHVHAAAVAKHIGANHHVLMLNPDDLLESFRSWIDVFDEPFGDPAALPTMLLSHHARKGVTVVLTGEGADEIFGGYANYGKRAGEERFTRVLGGRFSPLPGLVRHLPTRVRKERMVKAIGEKPSRRYGTIPNIFDRALLPTISTPGFAAAQRTAIVDYAERYFDECNSPAYIEKIMHVDARLWLVDDLLTKVDRATMSISLEARVPYLDHRFAEFCARLRPEWKVRGPTGKYLLKKVAERYLPKDVIHRGKQGFTLPLTEWIAGPLRDEATRALRDGLAKRGLLRADYLESLLDRQLNRGRNETGRIWSLLILEKWFERWAPDFKLD